MSGASKVHVEEQLVQVPVEDARLEGILAIPASAYGIVVFAHGSGSSRHSPRNRFVAGALGEAGLATLLIDLLTQREEDEEAFTGYHRFNIDLLGGRLVRITEWLLSHPEMRALKIGYFGASTGAAAALVAAALRPGAVAAVVSRGGRPDLAGPALAEVRAPTLLIVGENDVTVLSLNREALRALQGEKALKIVPRATHLFEEPGALEDVAQLACEWFARHLSPAGLHSRTRMSS
jgi:putative phosphoribosyl transferase